LYSVSKVVDAFIPFVMYGRLKLSLILLDSTPLPND